jgi:molecular chaperone HscC
LTGERRELVIVDQEIAAGADFEQRRIALAALKQHPRDADANKYALARAARCFETFLGDKRDYVARLSSEFEGVLDRQDPREVEAAREKLLAALDTLEGESWL